MEAMKTACLCTTRRMATDMILRSYDILTDCCITLAIDRHRLDFSCHVNRVVFEVQNSTMFSSSNNIENVIDSSRWMIYGSRSSITTIPVVPSWEYTSVVLQSSEDQTHLQYTSNLARNVIIWFITRKTNRIAKDNKSEQNTEWYADKTVFIK